LAFSCPPDVGRVGVREGRRSCQGHCSQKGARGPEGTGWACFSHGAFPVRTDNGNNPGARLEGIQQSCCGTGPKKTGHVQGEGKGDWPVVGWAARGAFTLAMGTGNEVRTRQSQLPDPEKTKGGGAAFFFSGKPAGFPGGGGLRPATPKGGSSWAIETLTHEARRCCLARGCRPIRATRPGRV